MASYTIATHIGTRDQSPSDILCEMERIKAAFPQVRIEKVELTASELEEIRRLAQAFTPPGRAGSPPEATRVSALLGVEVVVKD